MLRRQRQALCGLALVISPVDASANIHRAAFFVNARPRGAAQLPTAATRIMASSIDAQQADATETLRSQSLEQLARLESASDDGCPMTSKLLASPADVAAYLRNDVDAILYDCDGVLHRGTDPAPDAAAALASLTSAGKRIFFCTNNAGKNRRQLRDKLASLLGMEHELTVEQMVTSSYSAARYLRRELPRADADGGGKIPRVHVVGTEGLKGEIAAAGFRVQGGQSDPYDPSNARGGMSPEELASYPFPRGGDDDDDESRIDAFVVGLDTEFNYRKLCVANVLMQRHPDALFVATNEDAYDLVGVDGRRLPGNGALVKALEHCSRRKAVCVGKPSPLLAELIATDHDLDASRTLFVGDRLDTDVRFGVESGMKTALVLTGCTTAEKVVDLCKDTEGRGTEEEPMPSVIFPHVGMMMLEEEEESR